MNYKTLIKELRNKMLLTQKEFAEFLCVSIASVARWETGVNEPTMKIKRKLKELCEKNNMNWEDK